MRIVEEKYDIFISHAVEDKHSITNLLYQNLREANLKVWYSGDHLRPGASIASCVNQSMLASSFGVVVLSPHYFHARWALAELDALLSMEVAGLIHVLPVWHQVEFEDVVRNCPLLAGRFGVSTKLGVAQLVEHLVEGMQRTSIPATRQPETTIASNTMHSSKVFSISGATGNAAG